MAQGFCENWPLPQTQKIDRILYKLQDLDVKTLSYTEARNQFAGLMEMVNRDRSPIAITRKGVSSVVLIAADEYEAMEETLHLLSTPANAERIRKGLSDFENGVILEKALCD